MTKKIVKIFRKIDLQLDSDTEYFGNGTKFQVGIRNRKKNKIIPIAKDASKNAISYLLQKVRIWKKEQREKQEKRETRLKR